MALADNDGQQQADTTTAATGETAGSETLTTDAKSAATGETTDDETVVVTIGEASPASDEDEIAAPAWVKELRKTNRELARENRELKQKQTPAAQQAATLTKPTLAGCDYDEDAFEAKLTEWREQQASATAAERQKVDAQKQAQEAWTAKLATHDTAKAALKVDDYEDAEEVAKASLSVTQQGIVVSGADNSALVIYALGKNPAKAKELAAITDPVKFAFAIARLETQLKITPKKAAPPPEKRISGNAGGGGSVDQKLVSLEAEAERTGDRSKVIAYNRAQRRAA